MKLAKMAQKHKKTPLTAHLQYPFYILGSFRTSVRCLSCWDVVPPDVSKSGSLPRGTAKQDPTNKMKKKIARGAHRPPSLLTPPASHTHTHTQDRSSEGKDVEQTLAVSASPLTTLLLHFAKVRFKSLLLRQIDCYCLQQPAHHLVESIRLD